MKKKKLLVTILAGLGVVFLALIILSFDVSLETEVAVIPVGGVISPGAVEASPSTVQDHIREARSKGVKGFLFQINSPGGTVVASRQLENVINSVEELTVCQFQDYAASGAYWAASACDKIVTDPLTMTGGIGVAASYLEYSEHMEEEGIQYVRLVGGDLKDMGTPYRDLTEEERELFERMLDQTHTDFMEAVAENRNITDETMEEISRGHVITGSEAKEYGIVDYLGGREEAKKIFEETFNETVELQEYRREPGLIDILFGAKEKETVLEEISKSTKYDLPELYSLS